MSSGAQCKQNFVHFLCLDPYVLDLDSIIRNLNSSDKKLEGLNELGDALNQGCSTASFLSQLEKLFSGLRNCLLIDHSDTDTLLKVNSILIEMLPDIQHSDDLEIQFAQLIPIFIQNLGSPKAVVRKSTHKCIATYVKLSKKLDYVLLHIIHTGLESQNTRTRQHSMLVIPALLSLKPQVLERCGSEIVDLMKVIIKKLRDPQDIVAKTARKLLLEINKCYPSPFENNIIPSLKQEDEKLICRAVLKNDEEEIQSVLNSQSQIIQQQQRKNYEESKQPYLSNSGLQIAQQNNIKSLSNQGKELSIVGKEILQSSGVTSQQIGQIQALDKIIYQAKEESRYPMGQNNLYFGFLEEQVIEALNENNQWKHANWHVREGALQLIAHCILSQNISSPQQDQNSLNNSQVPDQDVPLSLNPTLLQEICSLMLTEDKSKNQNYIIDILALVIEESPKKLKTQLLIQKQLNIQPQFNSNEEVLSYMGSSKEFLYYKAVIERLGKENFPYINDEGLVEFPAQTTQSISHQKPSLTNQQSLTNISKHISMDDVETPSHFHQETLAAKLTKLPSQNFMEIKRRQEEEKVQNQQQPISHYNRFASVEKTTINDSIATSKDNDKISMWLPSFNNNNSSQTFEQNKQSSISSLVKNNRNSQNQSQISREYIDQFNATGTSVTTYQDSNSYRQSGQTLNNQNSNYGSNLDRFGYTPEQHQSKPRTIQSNEYRQRATDYNKTEQELLYMVKNNSQNPSTDLLLNQGIPLQKNMSQSTGGIGGFNHQDKGPYVNDKLKLLKSNQKYKDNGSNGTVSPDKFSSNLFDTQEETNDKSNFRINNYNQSQINQRKNVLQPEKSITGPIKASHQDFLQTIINDETIEKNYNVTPGINKTKKPPLTNKSQSLTANKTQYRAQSVDNSSQNDNSSSNDIYSATEEPLQNAEKQLQQSLEQLKSGEWQKQFDGCNIIKRAAIFHKSLLSYSNPQQQQILKELIKLADSLRSQLAKNSILTIKTIVENIPPKDMDNHTDLILPTLIKKAADTNAFISESADSTLISICSILSEAKVFNSLQQIQNVKSNSMKLKLGLCYNALIEKLGSKIRNFSYCEKLIQTVVSLLNEGAIEVRNMAKIGLLSMKNSFGSQRELEGLLNRCVSNEKQLEKIKQILDKTDFESISNTGSTRYGSSMRTSSLDTRSASGPFRGIQQQTAAGSDGFGKFSYSSDFNMQQTFQKNDAQSTVGGSQGFNSTSNTFKKQSNLVSKPIDPLIMEEFKQIIAEIGTNDWNKRLKAIDSLSDFVKNNVNVIKTAPPAKFIQLIDAYCKVLTDNNAKVLNHAQQSFRVILLNQNLKSILEQNLTMIVQALTSNFQSTNNQVKEQGDLLFTLLEGAVEPGLLIPPITAQINLANNRSKAQLIDRLTNIIERVDKIAIIQKYVNPLLQSNNKIQTEASSNTKLKDALFRLQNCVQLIMQANE